MRWQRGRGRGEIEDRRGQGLGGGFGAPGGGGFGFPGGGFGFPIPIGRRGGFGRGRAGMGLGGILLVGIVLLLLFTTCLGNGGFSIPNANLPNMPGPGQAPLTQDAPDPQADLKDFVGFVVDDVQQSWNRLFAAAGRTYQQTAIVLFTQETQSGCGPANAETGPFYCPTDRKVYLDLGFFQELRDRFGAPGDFAEAYVIAHEFGHHVQNLLGTEARVDQERSAHPDEANDLSVRLELQADCYAGVWAHSAYEENILENGDLQEGLNAAAAVGDDRIQRETQGRVTPETFTHGTSQQRMTWFHNGFDGGDPGACDTFSASL